MRQSYGKTPRGKAKPTAPSSDRLIVEIHGRHDLEQFSLELQKMVARLHDHGAYGIEACTVYLKPLDDKGERIALWNEKGEAISRLEVSSPEAAPPYRSA
jgi:hypothetical protein